MNAPVKPIREGFVADDATQHTPQPKAVTPEPQLEQPVAADENREIWPVKVRLLHKPIRDNKNQGIPERSFLEPTAADIGRYGNPTRVDQDGNVIVVEAKMMYMMAALSGILVPFLERMDPRDWNSCAYRLRGFFLPDPEAW